MTSRAVFYSLRSVRFNRLLFNGRRWRFLDTLVFYGASVHGRRSVLHSTEAKALSKPTFIDREENGSTFLCSKSVVESETEFNLDISTEEGTSGSLKKTMTQTQIKNLVSTLQGDIMQAMKYLVYKHYEPLKKEVVELSVILSDDDHIQELNRKHLSVDSPTDVLSFPMDAIRACKRSFHDNDDVALVAPDANDRFPILILGDIIISLETAGRQAQTMQHDLITECRLLIVHGLLHLLGYDHENGDQGWKEMAELEASTLRELGWKGKGLIADINRLMVLGEKEAILSSSSDSSERKMSGNDKEEFHERRVYSGNFILPKNRPSNQIKAISEPLQSPTFVKSSVSQNIQLIALDMDGTLLTSDQRITEPTKEAIAETMNKGIQMVIATGKARPGAMIACQKYDLCGPGKLISKNSAGIFLQGLAVYTRNGKSIKGPSLSKAVVKSLFDYSTEKNISCVAFIGDECLTLKLTPYLIELHERFYEPLAQEVESLEMILEGQPVKKIVLMAEADAIEDTIQPLVNNTLLQSGSSRSVIAVEGMLEVIPQGVSKWTALTSLIQSLNLPIESCAAIGDGMNDYEMIKNASVGVAMGNAVKPVKDVADLVVASNDEDGIAEALCFLTES